MTSSAVPFVRDVGLSSLPVGTSRSWSARQGPVAVDRLVWLRDAPSIKDPAPGTVDATPVASSAACTLHVATDRTGAAYFVRRSSNPTVGWWSAVDHETAAGHLDGVAAARVLCVHGPDVWIERQCTAGPDSVPHGAAVDAYVTGVLRRVVDEGVLVGTGRVRVAGSGAMVCEDVSVASRLEVDQRLFLGAVVRALTEGSPVGVADAVSELCHLRPARLVDRAVRCVRSLEVRWNAVAFGLAIHGLGRAVLDAGIRAEPLVLLGDELLHRLDLAHEHRLGVPSLATADRVARILAGADRPA